MIGFAYGVLAGIVLSAGLLGLLVVLVDCCEEWNFHHVPQRPTPPWELDRNPFTNDWTDT